MRNRKPRFGVKPRRIGDLSLSLLMNEGGGGTAHDTSGYKRDGSLTNMNLANDWFIGPHGYALDFDGTDDHINLGAANQYLPDTASKVTFCFYMKSSFSDGTLLSIYGVRASVGDQLIYINVGRSAANRMELFVRDSTGLGERASISTAINDGQWHSIIWVKGGLDVSTYKCYVDGLPVTMTIETDESMASESFLSEDVLLAARNISGTPSNHLACQLSFFQIYNFAFSPAQVTSHFADPFKKYRRPKMNYAPSAAAPPTTTPFFYNQLLKRRYA